MPILKHSGFLTVFEKTDDVWRNIWQTLLKTLTFFVFIVLCQNLNDLYVCEFLCCICSKKITLKLPSLSAGKGMGFLRREEKYL